MNRAANKPAANRPTQARRFAEAVAGRLRAFAKPAAATAVAARIGKPEAASPAAVGQAAEAAAAAFLQKRGLRLIRANYRARGGEIDLIMRDGAAIVFVEVRRRASRAFGGAAASITAHKRRKLARAAARYLAAAGGKKPARFDAVLVDGDGEIRWQKNIAVETPF